MSSYFWLIVSCVAFVGSHFAMSHTFRKSMVHKFGDFGFLGVYSLISIVFLVMMVFSFRAIPTGPAFWQGNDIIWAMSSFLTLISAVMFSGSMAGNPSLPSPLSSELAARSPTGIFQVTRHPMMWSFALWGVAHIIIAPRLEVFILIGSIVFLALVGAKAQEVKKASMMGIVWETWLSRTSFLPRMSGFLRVSILNWVAGLAIWLIATWAHSYFAVPPAGIFRWL